MPDQRLTKLAKILVHYSLELKPGDQFELRSNPLAHELALLVYQEAVKAGAYVLNYVSLQGGEEVFYKYAILNPHLVFLINVDFLFLFSLQGQ